jgi:hypothetical protein
VAEHPCPRCACSGFRAGHPKGWTPNDAKMRMKSWR